LASGLQPLEAIDSISVTNKQNPPAKQEQLRFAVVGYPYIIHDQYISVGIINKLRQMGIGVVTSDNVPHLNLRLQRHASAKRLFWTFSSVPSGQPDILPGRKILTALYTCQHSAAVRTP